MRIDPKAIAWWLIMIWLLTFAYFCITGCTKTVKSVTGVRDTVYVEHSSTDTLNVRERASDTLYVTKVDTLYRTLINNVLQRDSVYIREKGDTVLVYKEHWNTEHLHDTLYKVKTDTVYKVKTDTIVVYKASERDDSAYIAKEKSKEVVKQKKDWRSRLIIGLLGFAVIGTIVWWLRKWASNH